MNSDAQTMGTLPVSMPGIGSPLGDEGIRERSYHSR
jgi:hypothetical protein